MIVFNLKEILSEKKMTLTDLSEETGISRTSLSQLSTGKSKGIQFSNLDSICTALDVPPGELFTQYLEPKDLELDITAMAESGNFTYHFLFLYKYKIKEETFWSALNAKVTFSNFEIPDRNTRRYVEISFSLNNQGNYLDLIRKKYGEKYDDSLYFSKKRIYPKYIRDTKTAAEKKILPDYELSYIDITKNLSKQILKDVFKTNQEIASIVEKQELYLSIKKTWFTPNEKFNVQLLTKETNNLLKENKINHQSFVTFYKYGVKKVKDDYQFSSVPLISVEKQPTYKPQILDFKIIN
ncbi:MULTISPECIES: helix-turn-helix domain-containing protein [Enterococcus]|uniref:helix-turn-helix domain-containing protein n=1 Tax=Enterococcus TaxID=1350 RepID=UPI0022E2C4FC|nr:MULTISPECIES: helix-turn-helix domain-containing protein [Enterococcus]MDT2702540.1 helix-turn-helix domain-containing protein [Enterococcus dongliensis]